MRKLNLFFLAVIALFVVNCSKDRPSDQIPEQLAKGNLKASAAGDVVGKVIVGYQGWFACPGDGSPINVWWHWSNDWSQAPSTNNKSLKSWPDMREYTTTFQTGFANLGNGQPAKLFSSYTQQTVDIHFQWMQQNGIDGAALQRFNPNGQEGPTRDAMATKVRTAAETYGRKFYIMYDVGGWTNMQSEIKTDWTSKMSALTSSSAYAKQNGKPVVCIWGFGFDDVNHPWSAAVCTDVINWFKSQGCYIVGGVPRGWRTGTDGSRTGYIAMYHSFNMLSPWLIGAIGDISSADNHYNNFMVPDQADCNANGIDYQPCVLPGDLQDRQRVHGDLMWRQFYNAVRLNCQGIYISMYDEYNEANQIAKTAETTAMVPAGSGFLALDEDGVACSADYYLRLTGDGGKMLKGQIALTATRPTQPIVGGSSAPVGSVIYLQNDGMYACSEDGTVAMNCNRLSLGPWEKFDVVDAGSGTIALKGSNGKYVTSASPMWCNATSVDNSTRFTWVTLSSTQVALLAVNNNNYVCSENGASAMNCNRPAIGGWETFVWGKTTR
jgi:hypothetical protein